MPLSKSFASLNAGQASAAQFGGLPGLNGGPLLIIAGAGSGKTQALAHRVAYLIEQGGDPARILLLTFSRRAAKEMERRVGRILSGRGTGEGQTSIG
jgi:DNA helicase II / ATP-dependent DNA helicase PcrA